MPCVSAANPPLCNLPIGSRMRGNLQSLGMPAEEAVAETKGELAVRRLLCQTLHQIGHADATGTTLQHSLWQPLVLGPAAFTWCPGLLPKHKRLSLCYISFQRR